MSHSGERDKLGDSPGQHGAASEAAGSLSSRARAQDTDHAVVLVRTLDLGRVEGAVRAHGLTPTAAVGAETLPHGRCAFAVLDPELLGPLTEERLAEVYDRLGGTPVVWLSGPRRREELAALLGYGSVVALVPRDHVSSDADLAVATSGVLEGPSFGWDGLVAPPVDHATRTVTGSADRDPALEELDDWFQARGVRRRLRGLLKDAADELITNAVFDAPVDERGVPLYATWDRRRPVALEPAHHATLEMAVGPGRAALAVGDPFGALPLTTVRRYLRKGLRGGTDQIDAKRGGAGLGLTRTFQHVDHLVVEVHRGLRTRVAVAVETTGGRRSMAARPTGLLLAEMG